ncbi:MAG: Aspartyl/glutamyl-tRNA(Asn/Gln) amidotransferase subunit C [Microgenomates group bacterium GW2011_GWB1_40_9]|nr:MAG: Aspartyl/glutamyl-tRNA(Asn/Gln) amidotransferase subunit C [Microgenomates group bacterium GW2011_GWC1_39_12]KKR78921.1 MAG: Aspartyl/glutamyl-tRNA(Asn/Gln) amidotransferase subunit C [Microgenomates group bacterium GW2011_GWB1_40_9]
MQSKKITIDVSHTAKLANLPLTIAEENLFSNQLSSVLTYVQQLAEVETKDIEPTAQVTGLVNVFREDIITPGLSQEEALKNAPGEYKGFFKVKSIF